MKNCPACQAAVDESSLAADRCAYCGAVLRKVPQRSVQDIQPIVEKDPDAIQTLEFDIEESRDRRELGGIGDD